MDRDKYQGSVDGALTAALERARSQEQKEGTWNLDITKDKFIIFSDLHKGARNGADDFWVCERAYNAALAYYFHGGYTLVSLGDVEELWEERPRAVLRAYERTLFLEGEFHRAGHLIRVWGNHDDHWRYPAEVRKHLGKLFGNAPLKVREYLLLQVVKGEEQLGALLLLHGHQGTLFSYKFTFLSRIFVRYFWRPFQRLTNISLNTPAKDWQLRQGHNLAMYQWSEKQEKLVLVAGHTHRPVFKSRTHEAKLKDLLENAKRKLTAKVDDPDLLDKFSELAAELEWVRSQQRQVPRAAKPVELQKPSYFNTGCCCFTDGDITGIEISGGRIALIRWPNEAARPLPRVLEDADLEKEVFAEC
jgi:predicted phosphodiesterase